MRLYLLEQTLVLEGNDLTYFETAFGGGCYGAFLGLDHEGHICRLLIDFQ
jgi:hypothetical protein